MGKHAFFTSPGYWCATIAVLAALFSLTTANAQAPGTPDWWPCVQRYVPKLSTGTFWKDGLEPSNSWRKSEEIMGLVQRFSDRDIPVEKNLEEVRVFLDSTTGDKRQVAEDLVRGLESKVNAQRDQVIRGIKRFADRQTMMIRRIEQQTRAMEDTGLEPTQKYDLEVRQKWDIRVFEEREAMINYLCEQPVLLEKKFFSVGRVIAESQGMR